MYSFLSGIVSNLFSSPDVPAPVTSVPASATPALASTVQAAASTFIENKDQPIAAAVQNAVEAAANHEDDKDWTPLEDEAVIYSDSENEQEIAHAKTQEDLKKTEQKRREVAERAFRELLKLKLEKTSTRAAPSAAARYATESLLFVDTRNLSDESRAGLVALATNRRV